MRALYRTAAAIAVSLPLVVAGSAIANASTDGSMSHHHKHHHKVVKVDFDVDQNIWQVARQSNTVGDVKVSGKNNTVIIEQSNKAPQSATQDAFTK